MANRISDRVEVVEARIEALGGIDGMGLDGKTSLRELDQKQALTLEDFLAFQNLQALSFVLGLITVEEANIVYTALGGEVFCGDWPEGTSLATKITIVELMAELLEKKARRKRRMR